MAAAEPATLESMDRADRQRLMGDELHLVPV
jgi:hypothetical protein